jgi:anthranilate phosphoribosyltransferase
LGLPRITVEDLKGGEPDFNAQVMRDFVAGKDIPSRTTALLNAASAIVADTHLMSNPQASLNERFTQAYALAQEAVSSGAAQDLLQRWIAVAQSKSVTQ